MRPASIDVPRPGRVKAGGKATDRSGESVGDEVCRLCAEEFVTVTPSLNMGESIFVRKQSNQALLYSLQHVFMSLKIIHRNLQTSGKTSRSQAP